MARLDFVKKKIREFLSSGRIYIQDNKKEWIKPSVTFALQNTAFETEPLLRESILFMDDEGTGGGFYTSVDEYGSTVKKPKNSKGGEWTAKEAVDSFNQTMNDGHGMDEFIHTIFSNLIAFGNCFVDLTDPLDPQIIPCKLVDRIIIKDGKKVLKLVSTYKGGLELDMTKIQHFRWNVKADTMLGQGMIEGILSESPNILEALADMRKSSIEGYAKFSKPKVLYGFPTANNEQIDQMEAKKDEAEDEYYSNTPVDVKTNSPGRPTGWDKVYDQLFSELLMMTSNPYFRALQATGFSPGVVQGVRDFHEKRIAIIQRIGKRGIEAIWRSYLSVKGWSPEQIDQVHIRLVWGTPLKKTLEVADIIELKKESIISPEQAAKMLKDLGVEIPILEKKVRENEYVK
jgi:hypothetical protein